MNTKTDTALEVSTIIVGLILIVVWAFGHYPPHLIANGKCFAVLGCNVGFGGYDALIHILSSSLETLIIVLVFTRYPRFNLLRKKFWKNFLIILVLVCFLGMLWEFAELASDQFKMKVQNINLTSPNRLDQPGNVDTMGDMFFSLVGASMTVLLLKLNHRLALDESDKNHNDRNDKKDVNERSKHMESDESNKP